MATLGEVAARLRKENSYLLQFWDDLSKEERKSFADQIHSIDISACRKAFKDSGDLRPPPPEDLSPIQDDHHVVYSELPESEKKRLRELGIAAIAEGKVAALVLAGGQASRLGSSKPKGTIPLKMNLTANDTLLCLQAARLARLQRLATQAHPKSNPIIPWLVMTSRSTYDATVTHLEDVCYSNGLNRSQVTVFSQEDIPAFNSEGRFLLQEKGKLVTAPNGNGGLYSALAPFLPELASKGVKYIHVYCVDNILAKVADPIFVGLAIDKHADALAKAVKRTNPDEKVGVICNNKGKPTVVEYSELGDLAASKLDDGSLAYRAGNIANHLFTLEFLQSFVTPGYHLPYHSAHKKIPYIDKEGNKITPTEVNGVKLEQFVFDVFPLSKNFYVLEVERSQEFSPLKNADSVGTECMLTCRRDLYDLHAQWLRKAGAVISEGAKIGVKPARSYDGEDLDEFNGLPLEDGVCA